MASPDVTGSTSDTQGSPYEVHWVDTGGGDRKETDSVVLPRRFFTYGDFVVWALATFKATPRDFDSAAATLTHDHRSTNDDDVYRVSVCDTADSPRYDVALTDRFTYPRGVFVTRPGQAAKWAVGFRLEAMEPPTASGGKGK